MRQSLFLFSLLLGTTSVAAEPTPRDLEAQAEEAFRWLDGLGFPNITNRQFVAVTVHSQRQDKDLSVYGFFIGSSDAGFTVFTLDLAWRQYPSRTAYEHRSISEFVTGCLKHVRPAPPEIREHYLFSAPIGLKHANFESDLTEKTLLTVLAWACRKNGVAESQKPLIARASELDRSRYSDLPDTLTNCLRDDIGFVLASRIPWHLGDHDVPLQTVVTEIEWCLEHFPNHPLHEELDLPERLKTLRRMILEDRTHDYDKPLASMSEAERIAELVFRLRDQRGQMVSSPLDLTDVLFDPRGDEAPASQLLALGSRGVPYLLPEVQNNALTRSVGWDMKMFMPYVCTVGDAVQAIIYTIAQDELTKAGVDEKRGRTLSERSSISCARSRTQVAVCGSCASGGNGYLSKKESLRSVTRSQCPNTLATRASGVR